MLLLSESFNFDVLTKSAIRLEGPVFLCNASCQSLSKNYSLPVALLLNDLAI